MRKYILLAFIGIFLAVSALAQTAGYWLEMVFPALVQLEYYRHGEIDTAGNGFALCDPPVLVTAYHVATDSNWAKISYLDVIQWGRKLGRAKVIYHDTNADVAFLERVSGVSGCLTLGDINKYDKVTFVGALAGVISSGEGGYSLKVAWSAPFWASWGEVTQLCVDYSVLVERLVGARWSCVGHSNISSWRGTSGSAIINEKLNVVGVLVGGFGPNDTIFVQSSVIRDALVRGGLK